MPAANSFDRVIRFSVIVPPPLQPQTPTRDGSTHGCVLSQCTASTRSRVSESPTVLTVRFSSVLLMPVAVRLSTKTTPKPSRSRISLQNVERLQLSSTTGDD